ncbi:class I SAM-dependent methyltransferase [Halieaceae bacterium IMCC14734]|uniref:Class I SAM-dependent methyltransferase n=1 Tax=Candidatus Litorirhabdus singularis TaxID=2518993 RepID=A0ABT3TGA1_9GAMM|nr:methyltransferase [Candidatus Litorirhabdus singularis]MCX2981342.1 class I SAM-dependent methyltransferase [Candidatus Litorirhabdus singularis]
MLQTPFGSFQLQRYPRPPAAQLQAWNGADMLLLEALAARGVFEAKQIITVNDEHGALSIPLAGSAIWTDSRLSQIAIAQNAALNDVTLGHFIDAENELDARYSAVLLRIPKQLSLLRWQLQWLREHLPAGTPVLCAGMDKHLPRGCAEVLEQYLGPTERHRGSRKARLFSTLIDSTLSAVEPFFLSYSIDQLEQPLDTAVNVFSRQQLDIGSRFLLEQARSWPNARTVVDLGCGNGLLGLVAMTASQTPPDDVIFIDESRLALQSAQRNTERLQNASTRCHFLHSDGLLDYPQQLPAPDLVLCNPPFHQGHLVDDWIGRRLLSQCASALTSGGELWLVANRHLRYVDSLTREFASVEQVARNNKFIIYRAVAK